MLGLWAVTQKVLTVDVLHTVYFMHGYCLVIVSVLYVIVYYYTGMCIVHYCTLLYIIEYLHV